MTWLLLKLRVGLRRKVNNPKPFTEKKIEGFIIREFKSDVDMEDLVWHRDREDRIVTVLNENDWKYQEDNKLPVPCQGVIEIKEGVWHRIIKGTTNLKVKIAFV